MTAAKYSNKIKKLPRDLKAPLFRTILNKSNSFLNFLWGTSAEAYMMYFKFNRCAINLCVRPSTNAFEIASLVQKRQDLVVREKWLQLEESLVKIIRVFGLMRTKELNTKTLKQLSCILWSNPIRVRHKERKNMVKWRVLWLVHVQTHWKNCVLVMTLLQFHRMYKRSLITSQKWPRN